MIDKETEELMNELEDKKQHDELLKSLNSKLDNLLKSNAEAEENEKLKEKLKEFKRMGVMERTELYETDKALYDRLMDKVRRGL